MELKDKLELLKFKVKTYHDGIEKCNAEIQEIEKKLY
jgi:chaperonin cofactor prefoldin